MTAARILGTGLFVALHALGAFSQLVVPEDLRREIAALAAGGETYRVVERMSDAGTPEQVAERYHAVVRALYYSSRDLPAVVLVAEKGIDFDLAQAVAADRRGDFEAGRFFRGAAKGLAYDLASYTWPGWDEPGIAIRTSDLETGLAAARLNLRLAEELDRGPEPMANAYFILGAHALAARSYDDAERYFHQLGEIARLDGLVELALLADGYLVITGAASGSGNPGDYMLDPVRERFREALDSAADFWIEQLDKAWNVFVTG